MTTDDSYTISLLHMDGPDGYTNFIDQAGKTWTKYGDAQIDTDQSKFGGASGLFDGVGDYIDTPNSADFDFGTGDWTVDFWVRPNGAQDSSDGLVSTVNVGTLQGWYIHCGSINWEKIRVVWNNVPKIVTAGALVDGVWAHIAVVRYGNTVTCYINGTADVATDDCTGDTINSDGIGCFVAALVNATPTAASFFKGWIDEVRISKGIARWTANFSVPTSPYRGRGGSQGIVIA